jgi:hypothetical protein
MSNHLLRRRLLACAAAFTMSLVGCAGYSPSQVRPGQTAEDVQRSMGEPTGRYTRPDGGERLEYARGPYGKHTYMIDLDASGRVTGWSQVLDEAIFNTIKVGMTRDEVLLGIGRPSETQRIGRQKITVWSYRYRNPVCTWFQVSMGDDGRVSEIGYGMDPICARVRDDVFLLGFMRR